MNKFIIVGLVLLFSGILYAEPIARDEIETSKNLYLACECEKHITTYPNKTGYVTKCGSGGIKALFNFDINLLYVLNSEGNKNIFRALHSDLLFQNTNFPIPGDRYPWSSRDNPVRSLDTEVTFDFIIPLYYSMELSEDDPHYSYQLLRFKINKYNLNYKINYYFGKKSKELIEYNFVEDSSDYYLKKIYGDIENNYQQEAEGSCSIIEKQL